MTAQYRGITERILRCAFDVHARLGPGLLESTYRTCLVHRLRRRNFAVACEVPISIEFDGELIATAYRADIVVDDIVLIELKSVECVQSVHLAQLRTYLEHSRIPVGLLLNFNVRSLKEGIRRLEVDPVRSTITVVDPPIHPPTPPNSFFPS